MFSQLTALKWDRKMHRKQTQVSLLFFNLIAYFIIWYIYKHVSLVTVISKQDVYFWHCLNQHFLIHPTTIHSGIMKSNIFYCILKSVKNINFLNSNFIFIISLEVEWSLILYSIEYFKCKNFRMIQKITYQQNVYNNIMLIKLLELMVVILYIRGTP